MILKALEMQGFKSFPDKTKLNFNKGITAVVGPNGSGKSNISDAVRWVLGEQSTKNLRGARMEDVIFSGTSQRRAQGFAEVTLFLDNADRKACVDEDELAVTRRFYRSGESEYLINGKTVRLRDVHETFMGTGLGRDGYSIVSQGKIADLISTRGNERREMFEEAAGISHYRYRRMDSLRKLDQAEENLVRLRDILTELEQRVEPLKQQSEKAKKFLVLAEEKKNLEIGLWLHTIEKSKQELHRLEDDLSLVSAQYEKVEGHLSEIEQDANEALSESQSITAGIEQLRAEASGLDEQATAVMGQAAVLESDVAHNGETIQRIENEKKENDRDKADIQKEIDENFKLITQLEAIIRKKKEHADELTERLTQTVQRSSGTAGQVAEASSQITQLTKGLADARVAASTAASSMEEIQSRLQTVGELMAARQINKTHAQQDLQQVREDCADCERQIKEIENEGNGFRLKAGQKEKKADESKRALDDISFRLQRAQSHMKMLDELEKHMEGYSGSVKAVVKQQKSGVLHGIHGPVSQLLEVKSEYAVAIETALGSAVQHIVTQTETDAKQAILYLKRNNLGRATFLPLTTVKSKQQEQEDLQQEPGYIAPANELIGCADEYRDVMASLLAKTAVAEDLDSAVAIAKKYGYKFKIVTLDGQVIHPGGSMTGGSQATNTGLLSRGSEIEKLKTQIQELTKKEEEAKVQYDKSEKELSECQKLVEASTQKLAQIRQQKVRLEGRLSLCNQQLTNAENALMELENERSTADDRIAKQNLALKNAQAEVSRLQQQIDQIQQSLDSLGEQREELEEERAEITESVTRLNMEIHDAQKDIASKKESINMLNFRLMNQAERFHQLNEEIAAILENSENLKKQAEFQRAQAEHYRQIAQQKREKTQQLMQKRDEKQAASQKLRESEKSELALREKLSGELARLSERKQQKQRDYDETVSKLYDEYELTKREAQQLNIELEDVRQAGRRLGELKNSIRALGSVNVAAIEEYQQVSERYEFMSGQISDVEKSKQSLLKLIDELTGKMAEQFREEFAKINQSFSQTFMELFNGGKAELLLEDPHDVLESNIEIKVQPPGKNVKNIDLLSGGEKGLAAIALLFAILKVNPSPFCIFDEVEAALDEVNVSRYAQYVRRMTENSQFIIITHRRGTMEEADVLYGITMQEEGVSKLLELKTAEMAKRLGIS